MKETDAGQRFEIIFNNLKSVEGTVQGSQVTQCLFCGISVVYKPQI